jgi:ParB family chromosome partitioning protein
MVRSLSDQQSLEIALVENLQREDLNPIEEAKAYRSMVESVGLTQDEIARRIGVSRPAVSNSLRLLSLADQVQTMLEAGAITAGHARTLVGLEPQEQIRLGNEMVARGLNVRQAEQLLQRRAGQRQHAKVAVSEPDADVLAIERQLRQALGTEVRLQAKAQGKGGRLVIEYYGDEELERLIELLLRPQA